MMASSLRLGTNKRLSPTPLCRTFASSKYIFPHSDKRNSRLPIMRKIFELTDPNKIEKSPLTKEAAIGFLQNVLRISKPEERFQQDPLKLLNLITRRTTFALPWQTITFYQVKPNKRTIPTFEETLEAMNKKQGGVCFSNTPFFKYLLQQIGYNVHFYVGDVNGQWGAHIGTIVKNLTSPGSSHLVEGSSLPYPLIQAYSMDFEDESPVYKHLFFKFKYVRQNDGTVAFMQEARHDNIVRKISNEEVNSGWYFIKAQDVFRPVDIQKYTKFMKSLLHPTAIDFRYGVRARTYIEEETLIFITEKSFTTSDSNGNLLSSPIESESHLRSLLLKYFPQFPDVMIDTAIENSKYELHTYFSDKVSTL